MLADIRHRIHARFELIAGARRNQRGQRARRAADLAPAIARLELRMRPDIFHFVNPRVCNAGILQPLHDLVDGHGGKRLDNQSAQLLAIGHALGSRVEFGIDGQIRLKQNFLAKHLPLAFVLQPEHDVAAVTHRERAVRINRSVRGTGAWRGRRPLECVVHRKTHPLDHALKHRDIEPAAEPGLLTQQQRIENARVGIGACGNVGDRAPGLGGRVRRARHRYKAALALDQQVVRLLGFVGPALAVTGNIAHDQFRKARVQRLEGKPHTRCRAGCEILHQHVGLREQLFHNGRCVLMLEIQRQAFLGPVRPDKM